MKEPCPRSGIGLKAFCKSKRDWGGIGNVEKEAEADNDECVLEHIRPSRWAGADGDENV